MPKEAPLLSNERLRTAAWGLFLLVFAAPAAAAPEIQQWTTANGARVLFAPAPEIPIVDARVTFAAGSSRDGEHPGIARMTSRLLMAGTDERDADALAKAIEREGAEIATGSKRDMAWLKMRSLREAEHLDAVAATAAAILARPAFPPAEIQRIRAQQRTALEKQAQQPGAIASDRFWSKVYGDHPYAHDPLGTKASLKAIDRPALQAFHERYYTAANANVAIVGDIDRARAEALAATLVGELPAGEAAAPLPPVPQLDKDVTVEVPFPSTQAHVITGRAGVQRGYERWPALYVANHVFGGGGFTSRLFGQVREQRGLVYSIASRFSPMRVRGPFRVTFQTQGGQVEQALSVVQQEFQRLRMQGPKPEAVQDAVRNIVGSFPLRVDSNADLVGYLAMMGFYGLPTDYLATFPERVRALEPEMAQVAFDQVIGGRPRVTVIVGGDRADGAAADGADGEGSQ